jgi:hypothetical protein
VLTHLYFTVNFAPRPLFVKTGGFFTHRKVSATTLLAKHPRGVVALKIGLKLTFVVCIFGSSYSLCQTDSASGVPRQSGIVDSSKAASDPVGPSQPESKRLFGIVPNYRTSPTLHPYTPISAKEKFVVASEDAFDRGTFILSAMFAGEAQLTNANRAFGQGGAGFGRYLGASYADYVIGDYMTEGIFPTILHQDPRYFRKGSGAGLSRLGYALGQIIFTHTDTGRTTFNYSEVVGNSTAVAISNAYYVDNRDARGASVKLITQLGVDAASNVLKEFWPDLQRKFSRKH